MKIVAINLKIVLITKIRGNSFSAMKSTKIPILSCVIKMLQIIILQVIVSAKQTR